MAKTNTSLVIMCILIIAAVAIGAFLEWQDLSGSAYSTNPSTTPPTTSVPGSNGATSAASTTQKTTSVWG